MNAVIDKIPALVAEELQAANNTYSPFHSLHEGWAVLKEEIEEAHDDLLNAELFLQRMWRGVKEDDAEKCKGEALRIETFAKHLAAEAIQVAAMAEKFIASTAGGDAS